jgi:hypothetical protein
MFDKSSYEVFTRAQMSCIKPIFTFTTSVYLPTRQSISHLSDNLARVELTEEKPPIISYVEKQPFLMPFTHPSIRGRWHASKYPECLFVRRPMIPVQGVSSSSLSCTRSNRHWKQITIMVPYIDVGIRRVWLSSLSPGTLIWYAYWPQLKPVLTLFSRHHVKLSKSLCSGSSSLIQKIDI